MKKSFVFPLMIFLAFAFTACNKEKIEQPTPTPVPEKARLVTKLTSNAAGVVNFTYDNTYRLLEAKGQSTKEATTYAGNKATLQISQNNFMFWDYYDGQLDNKGRVIEFMAWYHEQGQPDALNKFEFTYNTDGQLTRMKRTIMSSGNTLERDYVYLNGNLITEYDKANGQLNSRKEFTYYDNSPNKLNLDILKTFFGYYTDGLFGNRTKDLAKSYAIYNSSNVLTLEMVINYDLDAQGYPTKFRLKNLANNFEYEVQLEYNN